MNSTDSVPIISPLFPPMSKDSMYTDNDYGMDSSDSIFQTDEYIQNENLTHESQLSFNPSFPFSPFRNLYLVHQSRSPLNMTQRYSFPAKPSSWVESYTRSLTFLPDLVTLSDHVENDQTEAFISPNMNNMNNQVTYESDEESLTNEAQISDGGSTLAQTCFNLLNLLVGIGFLSLPYALKQSGWFIGILILISSAFLTFYTGILIWMCMNASGAKNYGELADACFGKSSRRWVSVVFILELYITCAAFIVLISDSLHILFPLLHIGYLRILASITAFAFLFIHKLEYLSCIYYFLTSFYTLDATLAGIFASINLIFAILITGLFKSTSPGSILHPAETNLWPQNSIYVSLTFGLVISGFAGHAVLPSICQDMKNKSQYPQALLIAFGLASILYLLIGVTGYLMYGNQSMDEITKNLAGPSENPIINTINSFTTCFIAFIPLPKVFDFVSHD